MRYIAIAAAMLLSACQHTPAISEQEMFFVRLLTLCGESFTGRLVSDSTPSDAAFQQPIEMRVEGCTDRQVRMPVRVGADQSRTWVVTHTAEGLTLKHDHRHEDGAEDVLSQYGGSTVGGGTASRQEFPADAFSRDLFQRENIPASMTNVWALEMLPGGRVAYELNRPGRHFRLEFTPKP